MDGTSELKKLSEVMDPKPANTQGSGIVTCPICKSQVDGLWDGRCYSCEVAHRESFERSRKEADSKSKIIEVMGGAEAYNEYRFDRFQDVPGVGRAFKACRNFNPDSDNLYLWGPVGRGKTHLARATALAQFEKGRDVFIIKTRHLTNRFRGKSEEEERKELKFFSRVPVLVIDEMGFTAETEFGLMVLCDILDARKDQGRNGIIMAANLFLDELALKMRDDRLTSRISGMCKVIEINTAFDWRFRK